MKVNLFLLLIFISLNVGCSIKGEGGDSHHGDGGAGVEIREDHHYGGNSNSYNNSDGGTYQNPRYQNIATICSTQFGNCGLRNRVPVGSPCVCSGPYGAIPGISQ